MRTRSPSIPPLPGSEAFEALVPSDERGVRDRGADGVHADLQRGSDRVSDDLSALCVDVSLSLIAFVPATSVRRDSDTRMHRQGREFEIQAPTLRDILGKNSDTRIRILGRVGEAIRWQCGSNTLNKTPSFIQ
jgi:hypothetical protein